MTPQTKIDYFVDERAKNLILYGNEEHYSVPSVSFWYQILPLLFDNYVKRNQPDMDYQELYNSEGAPHITKVFNRVHNAVFRILFCFIDTPEKREATEEEIEEYKKRKDLLGIISALDSQFSPDDSFHSYRILLNFLSNHKNYEITLKDFLPKPLEKEYIRNFKGIFYFLAKETGKDEIKTEIDKFKFIFSPKALKKVPNAKGFSVANTNNIRSVLVFKNSLFTIQQEQFLLDLLTTDTNLIEGVIFEDCFFKGPIEIKAHWMQPRILFSNSRFQEKITFPEIIRWGCDFKNCFIEGCLNFYEAYFARSFRIINCIFSEGSVLTLSKTTFNNPIEAGVKRHVTIRDNIFKGQLEFDDSFLNCKLIMKNLSFFAPFNFKGTKFGDYCTFNNFAFVSGNNPKIEHSKEILANQLIKCNYTIEATNLGLSSTAKKSAFDYGAYQAALQSGWLSTKQAAQFLGKSDNYLNKKRMSDKKMVTQQTIPSRGEGKDIQYPVDALLAFKAKDWNKLKELRQKYKDNK